MAEKNNTLKVVGIGCGILLVLGGCLVAVLAVMGYRTAKDLEEQVKGDPTERVAQILGTSEYPEGYFPTMAMEIPFVMDMALLSDEPFVEGSEPKIGEGNGFFYTGFRFMKEKNSEELNAFFRGETDDPSVLKDNHINIRFKDGEIRNRGIFDLNGMNVRFVTTSEGVTTDKFNSKGLTTVLLFGCPDNKARFGLWYTQDVPEGEDLTGTIADEANIREFVARLHLCGAPEE